MVPKLSQRQEDVWGSGVQLHALVYRGLGGNALFEALDRDTDYSEVSHGFPPSLQACAGTEPQLTPFPVPSASFRVHYSLNILAFDAR